MIETELYKYDYQHKLDEHIEYAIKYDNKKLLSCSIRSIFWSFSIFNYEATLVWEI